MEQKFHEIGMPLVLKQCESRRKGRIIQNPPYTSVVHKRDHKITYTKDNTFVALVLVYYEPDGTERVQFVEFVGPDGTIYRLQNFSGSLG